MDITVGEYCDRYLPSTQRLMSRDRAYHQQNTSIGQVHSIRTVSIYSSRWQLTERQQLNIAVTESHLLNKLRSLRSALLIRDRSLRHY